jgi:hypothetical protein
LTPSSQTEIENLSQCLVLVNQQSVFLLLEILYYLILADRYFIKDSVIDSKNEQHVSSDFIKGRDDIVIIEQEMQQQSPTVNKSNDLPESGSIKSLKEGKQTADLPKPNTVINFRSLFGEEGSTESLDFIFETSISSVFSIFSFKTTSFSILDTVCIKSCDALRGGIVGLGGNGNFPFGKFGINLDT